MTANPWRGEVEVTLGGKPYILRPTFAALSNIEQQLGIGLIALAKKLTDCTMTLEELAAVIGLCAIEPLPDIQEVLICGELADAMKSVSRMFSAVFGGIDDI